MTTIPLDNGKPVIRDGKIGSGQECCCCPECTGSTCCGGDYPRSVGVCCEAVWRMPGEGTCCDGVWYVTGTPGECCDGVWHTDEDSGDCCGGVWHPVPEGQTAPDTSATPFVPVAWEAEECPEGTIYARYGEYGECCGCIDEQVFDPRAGEHEPGYPPPGAYVPTASVIADVCCDRCPGPLYLPFDTYGNNIGCLGTCCADENCSRLLQSQCASGVHPTHPNATYYSWTPGDTLHDKLCCQDNPCAVPCCIGGDLVEVATFAIASAIEGEWTLTFGATVFTYTAEAGDTAYDIAYNLAGAVAPPFSTPEPSAPPPGSNQTIEVTGPDAGAGTITPPGGEPQPPTSSETKLMSSGACSAMGGTPTPSGDCGCKAGETCCETATSSGTLLTFNKPAQFSGTVRVTVTGTTTSPILVYDTPFGEAATSSKKCPLSHTFLLCQGTFNISPLPCGGTFHRVDVAVCYTEEATSTETFDFKGCNGPIALGACPTECATTLLYTGAGLTSSAAISLYRDSTIEANGTGPLILGVYDVINITRNASCVDSLTLTGTSTAANEIKGGIGGLLEFLADFQVVKRGAGTWWLTGKNRYGGGLSVLDGTLIVNNVPANQGQLVPGPLGETWDGVSIRDASATNGTATFLITESFNQSIRVQPGVGQVAVIGGYGLGSPILGSPSIIFLGGDVTLQSQTGRTLICRGYWGDLDTDDYATFLPFNVTIGSEGNAGTVLFQNWLPDLTSLHVRYGTIRLNYQDQFGAVIGPATPVIVGDTGTSVTVRIGNFVTQPMFDITFQGLGSNITSNITAPTPGILKLIDSPTVTLAGTGHEISAAVALDDDATLDGTGGLLVSGVVSGDHGVTMDGSGTVTLSGANTYTGTTTINSGTLKAGSLTAFGTGGITVNAGGTLDKNGFAIANTITNNGGTVLN